MNKKQVMDQHVVTDFADYDFARDAILFYANSPLFQDDDNRYECSLYRRKLRPHVLKYLDFSKPLSIDQIADYAALSSNRLLASMYEQDFLILPDSRSDNFCKDEFAEFYSPKRKAAAGCAIPILQCYLFNFLKQEVQIEGDWNLQTVATYFEHYADSMLESETVPRSVEALKTSENPLVAARDFLIQLAPDFLLESSPMARYAAGSYGEIGSSLFKIIIDELGYGVYRQKHSVLFGKTLMSAGLDPMIHTYWQYYLNGSLMLSNYYNMLTRDKQNIFRYIGAIYQAETTFITTCAAWKSVLQEIIPELDVRYFTEHVHIDQHHSRMVLDELVLPTIKLYGECAAVEIVRGFEEACWLNDFAEKDFCLQTNWKDKASTYQDIHVQIFNRVKQSAAEGQIKKQTFIEPLGELSVTHSHDDDELCHINSGTMEYLNGFEKSTILQPGDGIIIKNGRLHGALIESESCDYSIYTIGDYREWL